MITYANYFGGTIFFLHLEWGGSSQNWWAKIKMHQPCHTPPLIYDRSLKIASGEQTHFSALVSPAIFSAGKTRAGKCVCSPQAILKTTRADDDCSLEGAIDRQI